MNYVDHIMEEIYRSSFIDSRTGIQKRRLESAVKLFVKKNLNNLERFTNRYREGGLNEENYKFLMRAISNKLYLEIQKKKGIRRANTQWVIRQIPNLIYAGIKGVVQSL
jgi:hypothetical protein